MGLIVTCPIPSIAITSDATQDLWTLIAATGTQIRLIGWEITSDAIAAVLMEMTLTRVTAVGSGGSAGTETKVDPSQTAAITGSVTFGNTTQGAAGDVLAGYGWEQLGPVGQIYVPKVEFVIPATDGIALAAETADAFEMSGYITWEEIS